MTLAGKSRTFPVLSILFFFCQTPEIAHPASTAPVIEMESYLRMIWGLLVVLGIILALYGLLRKRFSLLAGNPGKSIQILEIKPLMGKKSLCLVTVKGNEYLIGISNDRIDHIATLPGTTGPSFEATLRATEAEQRL
ncbi:MAG: flagellar biosynthetic protein FliO [Desulforhopalus sp.]|nr:flagellar biosynthetic protein FliO [Desulforhopalus sp.]